MPCKEYAVIKVEIIHAVGKVVGGCSVLGVGPEVVKDYCLSAASLCWR